MTIDLLSKLERLTRLREQDILTEAEFVSHKESLVNAIEAPAHQIVCEGRVKHESSSVWLYMLSGLASLGILVSLNEEPPPAGGVATSAIAKANTPRSFSKKSERLRVGPGLFVPSDQKKPVCCP